MPFILPGKMILQQLYRERLDWDEPIGESQLTRWDEWLRGMEALGTQKVPDACVTSAT